MKTTRDFEARLNDAKENLDHCIGKGTDMRTRTRFAWASLNLSTWESKGTPGQSQMVGSGSHSGGHYDLSDRVTSADEKGQRADAGQFASQHKALIKQVLLVESETAKLRKLVDAATTTKPLADQETSDEECRLCALIPNHRCAILARGLCRWCYDLARRLTPDGAEELTLPHTDLVRRHAEMRQVSINLIARYHPIPTPGTDAA